MRRGLGAGLLRDSPRARSPSDDVVVEGVLEVCRCTPLNQEPADVGLVVAEQEGRVAIRVQGERVQLGMACFHCSPAGDSEPRLARVCLQDQVLRNQSCGRRWSTASSGRGCGP